MGLNFFTDFPYGVWVPNGYIYWEVHHNIVAFDLRKEKFRELTLPDEVEKECMKYLCVVGGCLGMCYLGPAPKYEVLVWTMKEDNDKKERLIKLMTISCKWRWWPACFLENGKVLLVKQKEEIQEVMVEFPQEIIVEIFSRLPAKSLGRFKSVSKPLHNSISDPHFVETHLTRQKKQIVIFMSLPPSLFSINTDESFGDNVAETSLDFLQVEWNIVLGSCNGLILLTKLHKYLILLNPTRRIYKKVPLPSFSIGFYCTNANYGFGYDSSTDDYKVVEISYEHEDTIFYGMDIANPLVKIKSIGVYSIKSETWGKCHHDPSLTICRNSEGVFVNGSLHWLAERGNASFVIAAFDLEVEKFGALLPPTVIDNPKCLDYKLKGVGGCLCMYDYRIRLVDCLQRDVWVMKKYGVVESWVKLEIFHPNMYFITPLTLLTDGCMLVKLVIDRMSNSRPGELEFKWLVYNDKGEALREIFVDGICKRYGIEFDYVESLVSPFGN
ncbi:hypothetical protein LguiA_030546 [Lonicera macranthoides]